MAHGGEKVCLGLACKLGLLLGRHQALLRLLEPGDIVERAQHCGLPLVAQRGQSHLQHLAILTVPFLLKRGKRFMRQRAKQLLRQPVTPLRIGQQQGMVTAAHQRQSNRRGMQQRVVQCHTFCQLLHMCAGRLQHASVNLTAAAADTHQCQHKQPECPTPPGQHILEQLVTWHEVAQTPAGIPHRLAQHKALQIRVPRLECKAIFFSEIQISRLWRACTEHNGLAIGRIQRKAAAMQMRKIQPGSNIRNGNAQPASLWV